jgi:hypothetical protein
MTEIKSALELALSRTQDIKGDKEQLTASERRNDGKRLASKFLNPGDEAVDPASAIKKFPNDAAGFVREGFFQTLTANLSLPVDGEYKSALRHLEEGMHVVIKERRQISYLFQQVDQFFEQYLQTREQVAEQLKQQYEPQLREKERLLAKQMGAQVKLAPESDPEFVNILSKNLSRLEAQYNQALAQVKDELARLFNPKR